ncbi:MAG TPA: alpha/beta fold hydrolase [Dokdonella sp.]|nr:alpha/beta fold hydrolase [Dokdonella sp.]
MLSRIGTGALASLLWLSSSTAIGQVALPELEGAWLGTMQIPDGPKLRVGVEIFKKADGRWGGNVASLDQGVRYMLVSSVEVKDETVKVELAGAPVSISGTFDPEARTITGKFTQEDKDIALALESVAALPEINRPQTPSGDAPYRQSEVRIHNALDDVWLAGTLTAPSGSEPHPAVLLIAGSGPNQRDSYFAGHRPFKVMADYLARQGYVVLQTDKRGVYKSSGDFGKATIADFVRDARAAIHFLQHDARVDPTRIALIGHSEGSMVAAMVATTEKVNTIVSMAGPGMSVLDTLLLQDQTEPAAKGATEADTRVLLDFSRKFYQTVLDTADRVQRKKKLQALYDNLSAQDAPIVDKWNDRSGTLNVDNASSESFFHFLQDDPAPSWRKVSVPVLVLQGDKDSQVAAHESVDAILAALQQDPAPAKSRIFQGLNHMFQTARTGATDEYGKIDESISPLVLSTIAQWLDKVE